MYVHRFILVELSYILFTISGEIILSPDIEEEVKLSISLLPAINATNDKCLSSAPEFRAEYVTLVTFEFVYDVYSAIGVPVSSSGTECGSGQQKYYTLISNIRFINDRRLVGEKFRLKVTISNDGNGTVSKQIFVFPAPLNLTGSSTNAVFNHPFTWTCEVTPDYPIVGWYRNSGSIGYVFGFPNGTCATQDTVSSYVYDCQRSTLTYTLTIPGTSMTDDEQGTYWRCRDQLKSDLNGSKYLLLTMNFPVANVTLTPKSIINVKEYSSVNVSCETDACSPAAEISWYIDSNRISSNIVEHQQSQGDKYITTSTLTLIGHRRDQDKSIYCKASNIPGITPIKSKMIPVNVFTSAYFDSEEFTFLLELNTSVSMVLPFSSNPPAQLSDVEWINTTGSISTLVKQSKDISLSLVDKGSVPRAQDLKTLLQRQKVELNITSFQNYHLGNYTVRITNVETLASSVNLKFVNVELPQRPSNVTVRCTGGVADISWISNYNGGLEQVFNVLYKEDDTLFFRVYNQDYHDTGEGHFIHAVIENIAPKIIYNFKVIAKTSRGTSDFSETRNCIIFENEVSTSTPNTGGLVAGITTGFVVLIVLILVGFVLVMRKLKRKLDKGISQRNDGNSPDEYDDIQQPPKDLDPADTTPQGSKKLISNIGSTYEELKALRDVHTYGDVETSHTYTNTAME